MANTSNNESRMTSESHYAILGATGQTGRALLHHLLRDHPHVRIHLYARSESKLLAQNPGLAEQKNVSTFIGDLSETRVLMDCLRRCAVVFSVVALNVNQPGMSIAVDAGRGVVGALEGLRREVEGQTEGQAGASAGDQAGGTSKSKGTAEGKSESTKWRPPVVIMLSAVPLNKAISAKHSPAMEAFMWRALWYLYSDLERARDLYWVENSWVPMVHATPGALVDVPVPVPNSNSKPGAGAGVGEREGQTVKTESPVTLSLDEQAEVMTYADLARGMILLARECEKEPDKWIGKDVSFVLEQEDKTLMKHLLGNLTGYLIPGLVYTYAPWVYRWMH